MSSVVKISEHNSYPSNNTRYFAATLNGTLATSWSRCIST